MASDTKKLSVDVTYKQHEWVDTLAQDLRSSKSTVVQNLIQETKDAIEEVIEGIVQVGQQTGPYGLTKMLCYYVFGLLQNPHEEWFSNQKGEEDRGKAK